MRFTPNDELIRRAHAVLTRQERVYWVVGGAGSGKSTVCRAISTKYKITLYDMDAYIYGSYHSRFTEGRHPVNKAWSTAPNGLAWLLSMSWQEFDSFNRAAIPEYLDLLVEDLESGDGGSSYLIDDGISNPAVLAQAMPVHRIVGLGVRETTSAMIWEEDQKRKGMKEAVWQLPDPERAWDRFLEFDARITSAVLAECEQSGITVCSRDAAATVDETASRTARLLGLE